MKKLLLVTALFALLISFSFAQKPYKVVFYNLENFFDTINDPEVHDDEFTPEGPKKWNSAKYNKKLANTERVFFDIAAINKDYPVIIGVSEVENRSVLEDIIATPTFCDKDILFFFYHSVGDNGISVMKSNDISLFRRKLSFLCKNHSSGWNLRFHGAGIDHIGPDPEKSGN